MKTLHPDNKPIPMQNVNIYVLKNRIISEVIMLGRSIRAGDF